MAGLGGMHLNGVLDRGVICLTLELALCKISYSLTYPCLHLFKCKDALSTF